MSQKKNFMERIKHAFAVQKPADFIVDERTEKTIDSICREIIRREMVVPTLMMLEMSRPLNFLGSQALHFFQPFGTVLVDPGAWDAFAAFLEQRGSVEFLIQRLEDLDAERKSAPEKGSEQDPEGKSEESGGDEVSPNAPLD